MFPDSSSPNRHPMNIMFHVKDATLNERQETLFSEKIERLVKKLGKLWVEESSEAKISVIKTTAKAKEERFTVEVSIEVPGHRLVAREQDESPDNAVDSCIEKLKKQIEKTKTRTEA